MLQVFAECPIVNVRGEIVSYELPPPFTYLREVVESNGSSEMISKCSTWIRLGAHTPRAPSVRRSSPVNSASPPLKEFKSPLVVPPINDIEAFLAGLGFEKRNLLAELPDDLLRGYLK
jgi:hypothetical protein